MVVKSSQAERKAFSEALKELLKDVPERRRARWIMDVCKVRYQSAHKYLNHGAIPGRPKLRKLIKAIGPHASILLGGKTIDIEPGEAPRFIEDTFAQKLSSIWGSLNDEVKGQIVAFALISAATLPIPKDPEPQGLGARTKTSPPGK